MNLKAGVCTFCGTGCGHFLRIKDNTIEKVFPSQNHPVSKGRLCVRGWNIHELLNSSEKISTPLIRKDGALAEATYNDAIAFVFDKLGMLKPENIGVLASPRSSNEESFLLMKLARTVFKTNNVSLDSESGHRNSLNVLHAGTGMAGMLGSIGEIAKAEVILVVGIDITKQNPIIGSEIHKAALAGATLITIDSRSTQIAKLSRQFLENNSGTNKLVIALMAKTIIEEGLADTAFLNSGTEGYEAFAASVKLLAEGEAAKTGLNIEPIKKAARALAKAKTAMVFFSSGISGLDEDTIAYIYNLFLAAGKVGKEGCGVNPIAGLNNLQGGYDMGLAPDLLTGFQSIADAGKKFGEEWKTQLGAAPGKAVYDLLSSTKDLKALIVVDHDEGIIRYEDKIKELDMVVYIGAFRNRFMDLAHVVLPISSYIEEDGTFTNADRRVQLSKKKIEPAGNVLPGWKLYSLMAEKGGAKWGYASPAAVMDEIAKLTPVYAGMSHKKLESVFGIQWPCDKKNPDGTAHFDLQKAGAKVKFAKISGSFEVYEAGKEFPYLLMVGKAQHYWHQNNLMKKTVIPMREYNATLLDYPEGYIEICPESAKELQVRDRWPVRVISPFGEMKVTVKLSGDVKPNAAYAPYFVQDMITRFLLGHTEALKKGEDASIPVRIEKV